MPTSLESLQNLLTTNGYECEVLLDAIVATKVATRSYTSPAGVKQLEILLTLDRLNDCVAVEVLRAFDLRKAPHREAALACLMTASAHAPLVRPVLEPEGDVRLRVDCTFGADGARDEDLLRAIALLPQFADAWHGQITAAMETGSFDPGKVVRLNLSRIATGQPSAPAPAADLPADTTLDDLLRAARILRKPGGHVNRLRALFEFHRSLRPDADSGPDQDSNART